ncbi:MAG TPA: DUF1289 domain-containing protein [Povalibacter sp.]|nr:DUF1289 domain-containing protein [Povalibacter sp.]
MTPQPLPSSSVPSPCTRVCTLDDRGVCIGCGRELSEIANWSRMSAEEQREVCRNAQERRRLAALR